MVIHVMDCNLTSAWIVFKYPILTVLGLYSHRLRSYFLSHCLLTFSRSCCHCAWNLRWAYPAKANSLWISSDFLALFNQENVKSMSKLLVVWIKGGFCTLEPLTRKGSSSPSVEIKCLTAKPLIQSRTALQNRKKNISYLHLHWRCKC